MLKNIKCILILKQLILFSIFYFNIMIQINPIINKDFKQRISVNEPPFRKEDFLKSDLDFSIYENNQEKNKFLFNDRLFSLNKICKNRNMPQRKLTVEEILGILEESKNLTLSSGSLLKKQYHTNLYDFPLKFACACYNSRDLGYGYIDNEVPEIFREINRCELFNALDFYSSLCRKNKEYSSVFETTIGGKKFYFEFLGDGAECKSYKISDKPDDDSNSVIYKVYKTNIDNGVSFAPMGFYGNIGMLREANMAGVSDVVKLYFANPILAYSDFQGAFNGLWAIVENANNKELQNGLTLADWLKSMGLHHFDDRRQNRINNTCIDLGLISPKGDNRIYGDGFGDNLANEIFSKYIDFQTTQDLINYTKNQM